MPCWDRTKQLYTIFVISKVKGQLVKAFICYNTPYVISWIIMLYHVHGRRPPFPSDHDNIRIAHTKINSITIEFHAPQGYVVFCILRPMAQGGISRKAYLSIAITLTITLIICDIVADCRKSFIYQQNKRFG